MCGFLLMQIKVRFFASLAEFVGCRETELSIECDQTVHSIWKQATGKSELPEGILCAVNQVHCELNRSVSDDAEVAFFPPMTGG